LTEAEAGFCLPGLITSQWGEMEYDGHYLESSSDESITSFALLSSYWREGSGLLLKVTGVD
jgi:hypothetical protein